MKKLITLVMLAAMFSFALIGCSGGEGGTVESTTGEAGATTGTPVQGAENKAAGGSGTNTPQQGTMEPAHDVTMGDKAGGG